MLTLWSFCNDNWQVMALELGAHKIRVNSISPGLFKSEITENLMKKDWLNNVAKRTVPLREWGTSNPALTSIARYLIHDSSEYVTGNMFIVDAGATLPGFPIYSSLWIPDMIYSSYHIYKLIKNNLFFFTFIK